MRLSGAIDRGGALAIVGGYGTVGSQAARLLRARNPDLALVLAGRNPRAARPLARSLDATVARADVRDEQPLAALPERPAAILATVSDPADHLLVNAMREGIPIADINRGGHADVLDAAVLAASERPSAPVLLAGSWLSGLTALTAAAVSAQVGRPERLDLVVLADPDDRVGPDAWGFSARLAWPYHPMIGGSRRPVHPLTGVERVSCPDGRTRPAALVGTLEQVTLPMTLGVPTVETRIALFERHALWGLVALKRSGMLRALERPALSGLRNALLHRSGPGGVSGFSVTATAGRRSVAVEVLDHRGQAHLNGLGAAYAAERVVGLRGASLPAGVSFAEQHASPHADLAGLAAAGVLVRRRNFRDAPPAAIAPSGEATSLEEVRA